MPVAGRAALAGKGDLLAGVDTGGDGAAGEDSPKRTKSAQTVTFKFQTPDFRLLGVDHSWADGRGVEAVTAGVINDQG